MISYWNRTFTDSEINIILDILSEMGYDIYLKKDGCAALCRRDLPDAPKVWYPNWTMAAREVLHIRLPQPYNFGVWHWMEYLN